MWQHKDVQGKNFQYLSFLPKNLQLFFVRPILVTRFLLLLDDEDKGLVRVALQDHTVIVVVVFSGSSSSSTLLFALQSGQEVLYQLGIIY
jgi:hypothetical protein